MRPALARLLQLASPALPVGAFSYSQGLEWAVESGTVRDEASATAWIGALLDGPLARFEAPLAARMLEAWQADDLPRATGLNDLYVASRESAELRAETLQMGYSLARLLRELGEFDAARLAPLAALPRPSFPAAWTFAAACWHIDPADALAAWLWSWLENQAMAAVKLVPLGQSAGQRLLSCLGARVEPLALVALRLPERELSACAPGFAIASCRHETQYSRLFRS
jgi:urease accessory protein